jgi:hypothetical protein
MAAPKPEWAIQCFLALPSLQEAFSLEPLEVGQVAQRGEPERIQEFPRRDLGEWRARLRRADGAVDQAMALQSADHIAADLASREFRNLPLVTGCK